MIEDRYPAWVRLPMTVFVAVLVPIYWRDHGPGNFLWFSDIALFAVVICLWTGWRLLYSMIAVGVLPLELVWTVDFLTGGSLLGLAAYMFDPTMPLYLRLLSGFHLLLPPILIWMLMRQGYDRRAPFWQTGFAWIVLIVTWRVTAVEDNINWVHGLGPGGEPVVSPTVHLLLYLVLLPTLVVLPMHFLLRRFFRG